MMLLKDLRDVEHFQQAVDACKGQVILRSMDGTEEFNLKSQISRYIAIGKLCEEHGDEYEVFCMDRDDIGHLLQFFREIREKKEIDKSKSDTK